MIMSNFNFLFKLYESDEYIFYNSLMNSLIIIENKEYQQITSNKIETTIKDKLIDLGFIIPSKKHELSILNNRLNHARNSNETLNLTIAVTSNCNFRCTYCYEKNQIKKLYMNEEIELKLIKYVINTFENTKFKYLNVTWYGGEPLMNLRSIKRLSKKFIDFCKENNIKYTAGIITNGYLLSKKIFSILSDLDISMIQVTLDGTKEIHDKRRKLTNGKGSFDIILSNLIENYTLYDSIVLRVNIDKENISTFDEVKLLIKKFDINNKIYIYPGHVVNSNNSYCNGNCVTKKEFSQLVDENNSCYIPHLPSLVGNVCGADFKNAFVIDGNGNFYKCWNEIGINEKIVKNLYEDVNLEIEKKYLNHNPIEDSKCSNCKVLPLCMGGCIYHFGEVDNCSEYLYTIENLIRNYVKYHFNII